MKNLGKLVVNGAKLVIAGYVGYKVIEGMKKKEEPKNEEYVAFDDIPVEESEKDDTIKKALKIAGGVAIVSMFTTIKALQKHAVYVDEQIQNMYERDILILAGTIAECGKDTPAEKIKVLIALRDGVTSKHIKETISGFIAEVK